MASSSQPNEPVNPGPNEQSLVAEAIAAMQRRMAEQDAIIAEQMNEIRNLRQHLPRHSESRNEGDSGGNPSNIEGGNGHSHTGNDTSTQQNTEGVRPPHLPVIQREPLYARFGKMKPTEFFGSTDPLEAEEWISSIETILDFMQLNDQERVACASFMLKKGARHWWTTVKLTRNVEVMTWADFLREFEQKYYNSAILRAQQDEFLNLKQGSMTVVEAVNKFEQLSRLCPFMVRTEEERLRHMMGMFRKDIALAIESGGSPPTTVAKCVERAIRIEYRMAQLKEERAQNFEARRNQRKEGTEGQNKNSNRGFKPNYRANQSANFKKKGKPSGQGSRNNQPQRKNSQNYPVCKKCGRTHPGECRAGNPNVDFGGLE
ncbi:hypothetical protein UlMin_000070 [Ulmus minor]